VAVCIEAHVQRELKVGSFLGTTTLWYDAYQYPCARLGLFQAFVSIFTVTYSFEKAVSETASSHKDSCCTSIEMTDRVHKQLIASKDNIDERFKFSSMNYRSIVVDSIRNGAFNLNGSEIRQVKLLNDRT